MSGTKVGEAVAKYYDEMSTTDKKSIEGAVARAQRKQIRREEAVTRMRAQIERITKGKQ